MHEWVDPRADVASQHSNVASLPADKASSEQELDPLSCSYLNFILFYFYFFLSIYP